jgi:hypothetical protein
MEKRPVARIKMSLSVVGEFLSDEGDCDRASRRVLMPTHTLI